MIVGKSGMATLQVGRFEILLLEKELVYVINSKDDSRYDRHKTSGSLKSRTAR